MDVRWIKQWKKYVGYDQWDQSFAGQESASPGPVDNSNLFKGKHYFVMHKCTVVRLWCTLGKHSIVGCT